MAGVVPTKRSTSGRKQWTLHDGPRSSLKRLRNQLANDGCAESQVVLAKQLLEEECELDNEQRENERLGVYWLMKSSEQGNLEATELLKRCFSKGTGITDHNYMDVKSCINMTQDEKLARKAAREMFASLSNGEDYITTQQLQKRMLDIVKNYSSYGAGDACTSSNNGELVNNYAEDETEIDWSERPETTNEKLSEERVIAAAVDYSHGHLPTVNNTLCLSDPNLHALDHINFVQRSLMHPLLAFRILYYKTIKFLGYGNFLAIQRDFQLVFFMFLYAFVSSSNVLYFLPLVIYYASFCVMVVMTFQMLQARRDFSDFRVWSALFIMYSGGNLNAAQAEYQFISNKLRPYAHFFLSLLINLIMYPVVSDQWIPQSELTIIAFSLTFMTLHSFMIRQPRAQGENLTLLFSFAMNVLAKYPYETDPVVTQGWRFLDLNIPTFASYIIGNGVEFCINFRIIFYLFIPILLTSIASRQNWRGTYAHLIPHCVTLSWLQLVIINSQGATMFGLARGTLALVGAVMFLPLVGLTTIVLPAIALTKWLASTILSLYSVSLFILFSALFLSLSRVFARTRYNQLVAFLQILLGIGTFSFLIQSYMDTTSMMPGHSETALSWDQYQRLCYQPAWESESVAVTQMRCLHLNGLEVEWEGYVNEIKIKSVTNMWKSAIDHYLPHSFNHYFYCLFGELIEPNCKSLPHLLQDDCLMIYDVLTSFNKKCTLEKYNKYQFEITIRMHSGLWGKSAEISLFAGDYFKNFSLELKTNDKIKFRGLLNNNELPGGNGALEGTKTHVVLEEVQCVACRNSQLTEVNFNSQKLLNFNTISSDFYLGVKFVLNFIFHPIVVFK